MKKVSFVLVLLVMAVMLSGCGSNERLTNMTLVQAVGVDAENHQFKVTLQYLDINKGTGTNEGVQGNITALTQGTGVSIDEAVTNAEKTLPDVLFFGQNKLVVLGNGLDESSSVLLDYLSDNQKCRPDILMVKSQTTAEDVIKNPQREARVPAENICKQLRREHCAFTVNDFLNEERVNRLPVIEVKDTYTLVHRPDSRKKS